MDVSKAKLYFSGLRFVIFSTPCYTKFKVVDRMTYKDLMLKSLTDLLKNGETLMYPIYGVLHQGNSTHHGYFGFTQNHFLMVLISGKVITYTARIPLDIKSIQITKTLVFRRYVIDIAFHNGAPCRITASSKVLAIDSQKENLPCFLDHLKSRSPKNHMITLKDITGVKIRWQYFNLFICALLAFFPVIIVMIVVNGVKENNFSFSDILEVIPTGLMIWGMLLAPFIDLSLLNRFLFGKIIGVVTDEGLYLENNFILWKDIKKIVYTPEISGRSSAAFTFATIFVDPPCKPAYTLDILHFPIYGLRKIKKLYPEIEIRFERYSLFLILFIALLAIIIMIVFALFM